MSIADTFLAATQTAIESLGFTYGDPAASVSVIVIEQPASRETIDPVPAIEICQANDPEVIEQLSRTMVNVRYRIEIAVILAGNADLVSNGPIYRLWREQMRQAFQRIKLPSVSSFWKATVIPREVIDRDAQRDNYDISLLHVEYESAELAS